MGLGNLFAGLIGDLGLSAQERKATEGIFVKNAHTALFSKVIDLAEVASMLIPKEETMRLMHAGLCHTLGFLEEVIKIQDPKAFAEVEDNSDYWQKVEAARKHNIQMGSKHFKFHEGERALGNKTPCTEEHFIEKA